VAWKGGGDRKLVAVRNSLEMIGTWQISLRSSPAGADRFASPARAGGQRGARSMRNMITRKRGQGMTEYIIIVGLIAILLVAAVKIFKNTLQDTYNKASNKLKNDVTSQIN
jgi:Flp pilus assembly pilin Flp